MNVNNFPGLGLSWCHRHPHPSCLKKITLFQKVSLLSDEITSIPNNDSNERLYNCVVKMLEVLDDNVSKLEQEINSNFNDS